MFDLIGRNLTFSVFKPTWVHGLFRRSSCSSAAATPNKSFAASYLIDSCGFPPNKAISASKYLKFKTPDRADSVIAFFKEQGFTKTQISYIVQRFPLAVTYHPERNLLPKFKFLNSIGLSDSDIIKLFTATPSVLCRSLKLHVEPTFSFLRNLFQSNDRLLIAIRRCALIWNTNFQADVIPNMQLLCDVGVPRSKMLYLLTYYPRDFLATTHQFRKAVEDVVEMGFDPLRPSFMVAIHAVRSMSKSTWEKKMETYEKWGWSRTQILRAFRTNPSCMKASKEKIDEVMDFVVNEMGFETSVIAKNPVLISYSMDKRIIPRSSVYQYCLDNGLMKDKKYCGFGWWLQCSENIFIKKLERYEKEGLGVLKFYQEKLDHPN